MDLQSGEPGRYIRLTGDSVVSYEPCLLLAVVLTVAATGDYVRLYDGRDTGGRLVVTLMGETTITHTHLFGSGVLLPRGFYVDFQKTDSEATFVIVPLKEGAAEV